MSVTVRQVAANDGVAWLRRALVLLRSRPLAVSGSVFSYLLCLMLLSRVPVVGGLAAMVLVPLLYVGLMDLLRSLAAGQPADFRRLFSAFAEPNARIRLISLGVVYCVAIIGCLAASALVDGGTVFRIAVLGEVPDRDAISPVNATLAQGFALLVYAPVSLAYWFAPQLVAWHGMSAGKALFFSFFTCWRNLSAFVVFALTVMAAIFVYALFLAMLAQSAGSVEQVSALMLPFAILFMTVIYPAYFASYESLIAAKPTEALQTEGDTP
jgi:hypothetical protein